MDDQSLNMILDEWRVEPPSAALRDSILADALGRRRLGFRLEWSERSRFWFAGAGLAAAIAGVSCGALLSSVALREQRDEALVAAVVSDGALATQALEPVRTL